MSFPGDEPPEGESPGEADCLRLTIWRSSGHVRSGSVLDYPYSDLLAASSKKLETCDIVRL